MKKNKSSVRLKRVYEAADPTDRRRILIDRLWPRGVNKRDANVDHWAREIAPTTELRKWFHNEPARFEEFRIRYWLELEDNLEFVLQTFARDTECNHAVVLRDFLLTR